MSDSEGREQQLVLIADDDDDTRAMVALRLEQAGYDVAQAADGGEALSLAEKLHPDIAVLDVMMPKMDGYEVTDAMRSKEGIGDLPVILLTAKTQQDDAYRGFEVGAVEYMTKPFKLEDLTARVRDILARPTE